MIPDKIVSEDQAEAALAWIETVRKDAEVAHSGEDALWESVLRGIASGEPLYPAELARLALKSLDIDFPRWTA